MTNSELLGIDSNTYANIFTFMGLPLSRTLDDDTNVCVMGIPFDLATSGRSGTRFGPSGCVRHLHSYAGKSGAGPGSLP